MTTTRWSSHRRSREASRRIATCLAAIAGLAVLAAAASAQTPGLDVAGPWQASAFGGGWNSITAPYVYNTASGSAEVGFGNAPAFGVSVGRNVSCLLGFELSWMQTNPAQQYTTVRRPRSATW